MNKKTILIVYYLLTEGVKKITVTSRKLNLAVSERVNVNI